MGKPRALEAEQTLVQIAASPFASWATLGK